MTAYYLALEDEYGVLTVERCYKEEPEVTVDDVCHLAERYPDAIYFEVEPPPPGLSDEEKVQKIQDLLDTMVKDWARVRGPRTLDLNTALKALRKIGEIVNVEGARR